MPFADTWMDAEHSLPPPSFALWPVSWSGCYSLPRPARHLQVLWSVRQQKALSLQGVPIHTATLCWFLRRISHDPHVVVVAPLSHMIPCCLGDSRTISRRGCDQERKTNLPANPESLQGAKTYAFVHIILYVHPSPWRRREHLHFTNENVRDSKLSQDLIIKRASLVAQTVKNPPAMRETWVRSLGWEDPMEEGMAAHSSIFLPGESQPGGLQSMGSQRVRHDWATKHSTETLRSCRAKTQNQVYLIQQPINLGWSVMSVEI